MQQQTALQTQALAGHAEQAQLVAPEDLVLSLSDTQMIARILQTSAQA